MAAGEQGWTPRLIMLETWLHTFVISSGNLYRIITLPFSKLTTPL